MTEINEIKKLVESSKTYFVAKSIGEVGIILTKSQILSLITTIESQKEEIEGLHDALEMLPPKDVEIHERTQFQIDKTVDRLLIESLQKENERLVNFLTDFRKRTPYALYIEMIDEVLLTNIPSVQEGKTREQT